MYHLKLARQLRKNPTNAERLLWRYLRLKQISHYKFRRQHPLGPYIADFICLEAHLIIEVDGGQHNEGRNRNADIERTKWLEKRGFRVLRFWNNEVMGDLEGVLGRIWEVLNPHPNPPPGRGRG